MKQKIEGGAFWSMLKTLHSQIIKLRYLQVVVALLTRYKEDTKACERNLGTYRKRTWIGQNERFPLWGWLVGDGSEEVVMEVYIEGGE